MLVSNPQRYTFFLIRQTEIGKKCVLLFLDSLDDENKIGMRAASVPIIIKMRTLAVCEEALPPGEAVGVLLVL